MTNKPSLLTYVQVAPLALVLLFLAITVLVVV